MSDKNNKHQLENIITIYKNLLSRKKELLKKRNSLESQIYKMETEYLENSQGFPITLSLDNYLQKGEHKKYSVSAKDRIFSSLLPRVYKE